MCALVRLPVCVVVYVHSLYLLQQYFFVPIRYGRGLAYLLNVSTEGIGVPITVHCCFAGAIPCRRTHRTVQLPWVCVCVCLIRCVHGRAWWLLFFSHCDIDHSSIAAPLLNMLNAQNSKDNICRFPMRRGYADLLSMYIMLACCIKGAGQQAPVMFSVPHANGGNVDVIC